MRRSRLHLRITPPLSAGHLCDLLQLRDSGVDVIAYGERRISVPAKEERATEWLKKRKYLVDRISSGAFT